MEAAGEDVTDVRAPRERVVGRVGGGSESTAGGGHFVAREAEERERLGGYPGGSCRRVGRVENGRREEIRWSNVDLFWDPGSCRQDGSGLLGAVGGCERGSGGAIIFLPRLPSSFKPNSSSNRTRHGDPLKKAYFLEKKHISWKKNVI